MSGQKKANQKKAAATRLIPGHFGVKPGQIVPHVLVEINKTRELVRISEVRQTVSEEMVKLPRAELTLKQWELIKDAAQSVMNEELAEDGHDRGTLKVSGEMRLNIDNVGKELVLLAWAVEDALEEEIETIKASWAALHRVERWWLFNQTVRLNGDPRSRGRGWRLAVRHAMAATSGGPEADRVEPLPALRVQANTKDLKTKLPASKMDRLFQAEDVA